MMLLLGAKPPRKNSSGVTLIGLLVGLAISMTVILAALGLFQRVVKVTVDARQDAQTNAQRNADFVAAALLVQSAGFGISGAVWGTHGVLLQQVEWNPESQQFSGHVSNDMHGNAIVWSENLTGVPQCSLLWAAAHIGGLRLAGPVACTDATQWASLDWGSFRNINNTTRAAVTLQQDVSACAPFGIGPATEQARITFSANSSSGQAMRTSVCLANVKAP